MKCDRCDIEMKEGIAIPGAPEGVLCDPGNIHLNWPFDLAIVQKCPSCGRSLTDWEIEHKGMR